MNVLSTLSIRANFLEVDHFLNVKRNHFRHSEINQIHRITNFCSLRFSNKVSEIFQMFSKYFENAHLSVARNSILSEGISNFVYKTRPPHNQCIFLYIIIMPYYSMKNYIILNMQCCRYKIKRGSRFDARITSNLALTENIEMSAFWNKQR